MTDSLELFLRRKEYTLTGFKNKAARFPELEIEYKDAMIDPWLLCPMKNCPHFTILSLFEEGGAHDLTKHPYWENQVSKNNRRRNAYKTMDIIDTIKNKVKNYHYNFKDIKNNGWENYGGDPVFIRDNNKVIATNFIYHLYDGHHRTDIAKFLKIQLPVTIAKIKKKIK